MKSQLLRLGKEWNSGGMRKQYAYSVFCIVRLFDHLATRANGNRANFLEKHSVTLPKPFVLSGLWNISQLYLLSDISFNPQIVGSLLVHSRTWFLWVAVTSLPSWGREATLLTNCRVMTTYRNWRCWPCVLFMPFILFSLRILQMKPWFCING